MIHRFVCLLLVPTLLLQGIGFAHSHAGTGASDPLGHDQTPHFHWHFFQAHSPRHDDHDHQGNNDCDQDNHEDEAVDQQAPAAGHDDDAAYVLVPMVLTPKTSADSLDLGRMLPGLATPACGVPCEDVAFTVCFAPSIAPTSFTLGNPCALLCRWLV